MAVDDLNILGKADRLLDITSGSILWSKTCLALRQFLDERRN